MAHVYKRLKTRISNCIEGAVELRCLADGQDAAIMDICVERLRKAQDEISAIIHGDEQQRKKARKPARAVPVITYPRTAAPAADRAPAAGVTEAAPKPQGSWAARELERPEDDLVAFPPGGSDELWVEYALRGQVGGVSTGEAAQQLAADAATWSVMDARERVAAIKALAAKIDADYDDDAGSPAALQEGVKF